MLVVGDKRIQVEGPRYKFRGLPANLEIRREESQKERHRHTSVSSRVPSPSVFLQ